MSNEREIPGDEARTEKNLLELAFHGGHVSEGKEMRGIRASAGGAESSRGGAGTETGRRRS